MMFVSQALLDVPHDLSVGELAVLPQTEGRSPQHHAVHHYPETPHINTSPVRLELIKQLRSGVLG